MIRVLHLLGQPERELAFETRESLRTIREQLGPTFANKAAGVRRLKAFDVDRVATDASRST